MTHVYPLCNSVLKIPALSDGPVYDVVAILDPTTRAAQKYTPLIMVCEHLLYGFLTITWYFKHRLVVIRIFLCRQVLQEVANVNIKVFFNCQEKLSEMPLKR